MPPPAHRHMLIGPVLPVSTGGSSPGAASWDASRACVQPLTGMNCARPRSMGAIDLTVDCICIYHSIAALALTPAPKHSIGFQSPAEVVSLGRLIAG